jgi:hypothetical protein
MSAPSRSSTIFGSATVVMRNTRPALSAMIMNKPKIVTAPGAKGDVGRRGASAG